MLFHCHVTSLWDWAIGESLPASEVVKAVEASLQVGYRPQVARGTHLLRVLQEGGWLPRPHLGHCRQILTTLAPTRILGFSAASCFSVRATCEAVAPKYDLRVVGLELIHVAAQPSWRPHQTLKLCLQVEELLLINMKLNQEWDEIPGGSCNSENDIFDDEHAMRDLE